MVRNKQGGNRAKKGARRHGKGFQNTSTFKLVLPTQEGEIIARVTEVYGHGNFNVICNDGIVRLCIMRKKFKGRSKSDNFIKLHHLVLVGLRHFEVIAPKKKPKCDLMYVYSNDQETQLKQGGHLKSGLLPPSTNNKKDAYMNNNLLPEKEDKNWEKEFNDI